METVQGQTCEACQGELENPLRCDLCGAFQRPDPTRDHFATLGVPPCFELDADRLERRHLELSLKLHPDHATTARARAVLQAAQLNEAYAELKDPFRRAEYLVRRGGGPSASEDRSVPQGFLEETLELRADLEGVLETRDRERIQSFRRRLEQSLAQLRGELAETLAEEADSEALRRARRVLNQASYYRGLLRDLREHRPAGREGE